MNIIRDTLSYYGLKRRDELNQYCGSSSQVSDSEISTFLSSTRSNDVNTPLSEEDKKYFREHCEKIVNEYYNKRFVENMKENMKENVKKISNPYKLIAKYMPDIPDKKVQLFINIILNIPQYFGSWSDWLVFYPEGRQIIFDLFYKSSRAIGLANLFCIFVKVYVVSDYDDHLFQRNFLTFVPRIEELVEGTPLEPLMVRKILGQISTKIFLTLFQAYLTSLHNKEVEEKTEDMFEKTHISENDVKKALGESNKGNKGKGKKGKGKGNKGKR